MSAAKSKLNPLTINAFLGSLNQGITIDDGLGFNELISLALTYHSYDPSNLQGETLPTEAANGFGGLGDVLTVQQPRPSRCWSTSSGRAWSRRRTRRPTPTACRSRPHCHTDDGAAGYRQRLGQQRCGIWRHDQHDHAATVVRPDELQSELGAEHEAEA